MGHWATSTMPSQIFAESAEARAAIRRWRQAKTVFSVGGARARGWVHGGALGGGCSPCGQWQLEGCRSGPHVLNGRASLESVLLFCS